MKGRRQCWPVAIDANVICGANLGRHADSRSLCRGCAHRFGRMEAPEVTLELWLHRRFRSPDREVRPRGTAHTSRSRNGRGPAASQADSRLRQLFAISPVRGTTSPLRRHRLPASPPPVSAGYDHRGYRGPMRRPSSRLRRSIGYSDGSTCLYIAVPSEAGSPRSARRRRPRSRRTGGPPSSSRAGRRCRAPRGPRPSPPLRRSGTAGTR